MTIIDQLRAAREKQGKSSYELGRVTGVNPTTILNILAGKDCQLKNLVAVAKGLGFNDITLV